MSKFRFVGAAATASVTTLGAVPAFAQGFYLQEQSARAAGRAFSGEVADTGVSSLWWNPAAIAGSTEAEVSISASGILPHSRVVDAGTVIRRPGQAFAAVGGDSVTKNPIDKGLLPSGGVAMPITDRVAVGLLVTSPFSFTTDYDPTSWARYTALRTKLITFDIQPSVAVALTDWLRVGGAVNIEHSYASLATALPNLSATLPDGRQLLEGKGWDFGWSAGVQFHNDFATVGISYKSSIKHNLKGDLTVSGLLGPLAGSNTEIKGANANFRTPGQVIVGARLRATDAVTLNGQVVHYTWDKFDAIRLGAPLNTALPQDYRDSWSYAGGVDVAVSPKFTLRGGVQRALTPTQDGLRDARVPDGNRWNYGVGASYQLTPKIALDLGGNYVDFKTSTIDRVTAAYPDTPAQTVIVPKGRVEDGRAIIVSVGGRARF